MSNNDFPKQLLKGRIAENIFELMFRDTKKYEILPLGYEHVTPALAQFQDKVHIKNVYENIRHLPDFALISYDKTEVHLVEAKYQTHPTEQDNLKIAEDILLHYNSVFLFLA